MTMNYLSQAGVKSQHNSHVVKLKRKKGPIERTHTKTPAVESVMLKVDFIFNFLLSASTSISDLRNDEQTNWFVLTHQGNAN